MSHVASYYPVHVRTGGPNAGHVHYHEGRKYVARSIPCGWTNPEARLIIGPGAVLDLDVLVAEKREIEAAGYSLDGRLYIDARAGVITKSQHHGEGGVNGNAHQVIGSTGEGVGLCRMARINRHALVNDHRFDFLPYGRSGYPSLGLPHGTDTTNLVNSYIDTGWDVLLEGTQGSGLSLTHGPEWPYATSTDTNAGQMAVDAGISPSMVTRTILVARTFPIRVAGNSGPLPGETSWEVLGFDPERTTVTLKVRRVARWDIETVRRAVKLNRPVALAITFLDYLFPQDAEKTEWTELSDEALEWMEAQSALLGVPIVAATTGPHHVCAEPLASPNLDPVASQMVAAALSRQDELIQRFSP